MRYVSRQNRLKGTGAFVKKRRTKKFSPNFSRIKYQPPTARNQKRQILSNANLLAKLSRQVRTHKVYTDWHFSRSLDTGQWAVVELTDFSTWNAVLRQDLNVQTSSHTFIKRAQLNFRYALMGGDYAGYNLFIVTPRKQAGDRDPFLTPPLQGQEWIENSEIQGFNIRLNSAIWKVHYARYITLTANAFSSAPAANPVGNPYSTWKKDQVDLPLNIKVAKPTFQGETGTWKDVRFDQLPYYQKYYVMLYSAISGEGTRPTCVFDAQIVCINSF